MPHWDLIWRSTCPACRGLRSATQALAGLVPGSPHVFQLRWSFRRPRCRWSLQPIRWPRWIPILFLHWGSIILHCRGPAPLCIQPKSKRLANSSFKGKAVQVGLGRVRSLNGRPCFVLRWAFILSESLSLVKSSGLRSIIGRHHFTVMPGVLRVENENRRHTAPRSLSEIPELSAHSGLPLLRGSCFHER